MLRRLGQYAYDAGIRGDPEWTNQPTATPSIPVIDESGAALSSIYVAAGISVFF